MIRGVPTSDDADALSCDLRLYEAGGFYDGDARLADLKRTAEAFGHSCVKTVDLGPSYSYPRPIERARIIARDEFATRLTAHYAWINDAYVTGAGIALVALRDVRARDRALRLAVGGRAVPLYECHRPADRPYLAASWSDRPAEGLPVGPAYLWLDSAGSFNYGHWLLDDLTRADAIARCPHDGRRLVVLMTSYGRVVDRLRESSLRFLLGTRADVSIRFLKRSVTYAIDEMFFPSPASFHPVLKSPDSVALLAASALGPDRHAGSRPRLFVERRSRQGRNLTNAAEIARIAAECGFSVIDPERLSFRDQVAAFAGAEIVVGCMGAAMANTVFSPPGTRVLHLAPEGWLEPFYWDLAAVRRQDYWACYGPAQGREPHLADFIIEPDRFRECLARIT